MDIIEQLKEPFEEDDIHWRVGSTNINKLTGKPAWGNGPLGKPLAYINARDVMKRLDEVCGHLWQVEYPFEGCCRIGIKVDGEWIWRSNGAGATDFEGEKGQYSDAFKRAAVLLGVGRYLYYLGSEWSPIEPAGKSWKLVGTPKLPGWAVPGFKRGNYNRALNEHIDAVRALQYGIQLAEVDQSALVAGVEAWEDIPEEDRNAIYRVAPTNNGILTTQERAFMLSSAYREALISARGGLE